MVSYKKVLLISSWAPPAVGGPQNLYNVLKDFKGRYFILTSFKNLKNASPQASRWLSGEYVFFDNPSAKKEDVLESAKQIYHKRSFVRATLKKVGVIRSVGNYLIRVITLIWQINGFIKSGLKTVRSGEVDVLLAISDNGPALISAYIIHKITKKPLYIYLFDLYRGNIFPTPLVEKLLARIFEPMIFRSAEKIILTNEGTREFYVKRYGEYVRPKVEIVHNSIFPESYLNQGPRATKEGSFKIVFTGRIYWAQLQSLQNLVKAVEEIDDVDIKLVLYCPNKREYLDKIGIRESSKIKIDFAPVEKMAEIQSSADILFLPLSWNTKSPEIINTATPGKLSDYLIAGRPILVHAPRETFLVQYTQKNNCAMVVDENNVDLLKKSIKELVLNINLRDNLVKNAKDVFFRNHDANKNAEVFESIFRNK